MFGTSQESKMGTQKWHELDRVYDALRGVGDMTNLHARLFESCHKDINERNNCPQK